MRIGIKYRFLVKDVLSKFSQDHLMNAMTLKDMAVEIIDLRREIKK
jgi:cellobiose-specific phosphotransferase system component IIA